MITDEEIENLPEEPELAFVAFERILRERAQSAIANASRNDENLDEYRLEYMNKVLGAAKALQVDALKDWGVPSANDNQIYSIYQNFISDVDHYIIQIRIQNIARSKKFSVALDSVTKIKIHHFISQIKLAIEESPLEEHKKNSLYNKLNEFASEVDKSRTGWQSGMALYVAVCSAIGEGIQKLEPARKWVDSIAELLGRAKEAEDSMPRLPHTERKKLEPPRKQISSKKEESLDDEIPF